MSNSKYSRVEGGGSLILAWQIKDKRVLVIGGGYEASSRIRSSLQADAKVTVVCPKAEVNEEVQFRIDGKEVEYLDRDFIPEDLEGVDMCLSTDQPPEVGALIYDLCKQRGIPVNVADDIPKCDFWFMSNYKDKALQLAISSNGKAPRLAKNLRKKISESLPKNVGLAMENFGKVREAIQKADPGHENAPKRMKWCCDLCDLWSYDQLAKVDDTIIEQLVNNYRDSQVPSYSSLVESTGSIIIVGAGPGNPDLLTVAGAQALQEAELVVSDRLVSPKVLDLVGGELRIAPKKLIGSSDPIQQQLNDWVIEGAKAGKKVVRLKEGDPFVFGRVGEEIEYYKQHGYKPISIPGISSSISCAHSSLIPVTHRGVSDKLMLLTARAQGGNIPEPPAYSSGTTLVYLMAVGVCEALKEKLIALGYPKDLACMFIERSTHPDERCIKTTLEDLAKTQQQYDINPPSCIIIGDCVNLSAIDMDYLEEGARRLSI